MPKALIITEKPSVARDIVRALGGFTDHKGDYWESDRYLCTYAVGHILELLGPEEIDEKYKRWSLDNLPIIPKEFHLKPKSGQTDRLRTIKNLMNREDVDRLINACDAGREGELIFRELVKYFKSRKPIQRLWLQSMTVEAIRDGFKNLLDGQRFDGLAAAAECRSLSDWLIGMNASRAFTIRLRSKGRSQNVFSAGRVQTPTLALIVDRELEILAHVPEPYWQIQAQFRATDHDYDAIWFDPSFKADESKPTLKADRIFNHEQAQAILAAVTGQTGLARETRKPSRENPRPLFDLTSLQRECNSRFGWTAKATLDIAQRCYEKHKMLTYPRTDSKCLPENYVQTTEKVIQTLANSQSFGAAAQYLIQHGRQNDKKVFNDKGVSDHFAIVPTGHYTAECKNQDWKLYELVTRRFLAAFYPPAVWEAVERITEVKGHSFISRSRTLREAGWRAVFGQQAMSSDGDSKALPPLRPGQEKADQVPVQNKQAELLEDLTKPPTRFTEARLLSLMENAGKQVDDEELAEVLSDKGLGTPATRAETIEKLKRYEYIEELTNEKTLRATYKGIRLIDVLQRVAADRITSAELTAELELHLQEVEKGKRTTDNFMQEIELYAREIVDIFRDFNLQDIYPVDREPLGICPCDRKCPVFESGQFYFCSASNYNAANAKSQGDTANGSAGSKPELRVAPDTVLIEAAPPCDFRIFKERSGRFLDRRIVATLLAEGKTAELEGFTDRRGRPYKAILVLDGKEVRIGAAKQADGETPDLIQQNLEVNAEPLAKCRICTNPDCQVVETTNEFICQSRLQAIQEGKKRDLPGMTLPRVLCQREIQRPEAQQYFVNGETPLIIDFISKRGRPFKATLRHQEGSRFEFVFPSRPGKTDPEGADGTAEPSKPTPKTKPKAKSAAKATNKKTTAKKKTAKSTPVAAAAKTKKTTKKAPAKKKSSPPKSETEE